MSLCRWRQIKSVIKLNYNPTALDAPGHRGYNPAYKYNLVYKCVVNNCNALTKYAKLDLCGDEMTWKFIGYAKDGVVYRVVQKSGVTKTGQIAIVADASRCRLRAYVIAIGHIPSQHFSQPKATRR